MKPRYPQQMSSCALFEAFCKARTNWLLERFSTTVVSTMSWILWWTADRQPSCHEHLGSTRPNADMTLGCGPVLPPAEPWVLKRTRVGGSANGELESHETTYKSALELCLQSRCPGSRRDGQTLQLHQPCKRLAGSRSSLSAVQMRG
jgi:hypothetical protein